MALLLLALVLLILFGGLGILYNPLFFLALILVVLLAVSGGYWGHGRYGWW